MKCKSAVNLLVIFFLFSTAHLFGQKIYLSPGGNDSNPATREKPLASLHAARDKARELRKSGPLSQPVEIIALGGNYQMLQPLELTTADSGSPDSPLVIKSEEGSRAVFSGGVILTGFTVVNEKLWKCFVPQTAWYNWYFEQLFVNGRRAVRARYPDDGFAMVRKVEETVLDKGGEKARISPVAVQKVLIDSVDALNLKKITQSDLEDALVVFYHNWDNTRKRIIGLSSEQSAFFIAGEGMKPWNPINDKSRWYVENVFSALDKPGEWYLDRSGYLFYVPRPGETIDNTVFTAPLLDRFVTVRGDESTGKRVTRIRFEDISFVTSGYITPRTGNEPAQAAAPVDAVIDLDYADNISLTNCEIASTGTYAVWFRKACSNCKLVHSYLHDLGAGGVKIGETIIRQDASEITNNIIVDNNIIRDAGHIFPCAVGIILFNASDNQLTHNEIANLRYSGISAGWVWGYAYSPSKRNKIEFNHIHHLGWGELCDMGGVYTLGASEGTTVSNNVVHHVYSFDYGGWGLYTDEGSFGITEENNLVYACKNSGFHQHYGKDNIIRNNIFAFNIRSQLQATRVEEHNSITFTNNIIYFDKGTLLSSNWHKFRFTSDYNCYWDSRATDVRFADKSFPDWKKTGKDKNSVIADPGFTDPGNFDFTLKDKSVAKRIKFIPFDYTRAGVYGSSEWKSLAATDPELARKFDDVVNRMEKVNKK